MVKKQKTILWWGRFDPDYSRNRILRKLLVELGYHLVDFQPRFSFLSGIEVKFAGISGIDAVWVPSFRQRDFPAARHFALRNSVPLVFDPLISAWDKAVFERHKFPRESAAALRLQQWERAMFSSADLLLADTAMHAEFFVEELGARAELTRVVQVGAEEELFVPQGPQPQGTTPEVLFYGSFINLQGPEVIVEAALTLPEVRWTFLGDGPLRKQCLLRGEGRDHIRFEDWLSYEQLPQRIGQASILLGVFGSSQKAGRVIANKVFQSLACGRTVVTRKSDAFPPQLLTDPDCGLTFVPPEDPKALADAVSALVARLDLLAAKGQQARVSYETWFSLRGIKQALAESLELIGL